MSVVAVCISIFPFDSQHKWKIGLGLCRTESEHTMAQVIGCCSIAMVVKCLLHLESRESTNINRAVGDVYSGRESILFSRISQLPSFQFEA